MQSSSIYKLVRRGGPLLISIPHLGQEIPGDLRAGYAPLALQREDTDWHLDQVYAFAEALDATVLSARISRYVIDLNRPATGESLYPGMTTSTLCPTDTFRGEPLYPAGGEPDAAEIARRVETYWRPYHDALKEELARLRRQHANVLLWEAHSIASVLPRLFPGKLPDFNFGTSDGQSCDETLTSGAVDALRGSPWSWVVNGRFKGGFITRRYGQPATGVHAIQLEMCQSLYMNETAPFEYLPDQAAPVSAAVERTVRGALNRLAQLPAPAAGEGADILPR